MGRESMKVKAHEVAAALEGAGFDLRWVSSVAKEIGLIRASQIENLFERIEVKAQGSRGECVYAYAGVSVVRGPMATKGMVESRLLTELASGSRYGWRVIETAEAASKWIADLAAIGPTAAREFASAIGRDLLARTAHASDLARRYLSEVPPDESLTGTRRRLEGVMSREAAEAAYRLATHPGVVRTRDDLPAYDVAAKMLVYYEPSVEGRRTRLENPDPLESVDLMWLIQFLADALSTRAALSDSD